MWFFFGWTAYRSSCKFVQQIKLIDLTRWYLIVADFILKMVLYSIFKSLTGFLLITRLYTWLHESLKTGNDWHSTGAQNRQECEAEKCDVSRTPPSNYPESWNHDLTLVCVPHKIWRGLSVYQARAERGLLTIQLGSRKCTFWKNAF